MAKNGGVNVKALRKPVGGHRVTRKSVEGPVGGRNLGVKSRGSAGNGPKPRNGSTFVPKMFQPGGKLGHQTAGHNAETLKLNVRGLQYFLRNKGYKITVDGKLGSVTKAALKDAILSGTIQHPSAAQAHAVAGVKGRDLGPKAFDSMLSHAGHGPAAPLTGKGGQIGRGGSTNFNAGGVGGGGNGSVNTGSAQKDIKTATGTKIPASDANFGSLFNVDNTADAMAQEQFQPQINEAQLTVNQDPVQAAKDAQDIKDWYNQVNSGLSSATSQDAAASKAGVSSTQDATQALISSLGGSANLGSGEAAAAGQNVSGTLEAMGLAQNNLDSTLAPLLQAQAAQQKTNQGNIDANKLTTDKASLSDLQGQEGNAEVNAQMQLQDANNSLDQARQQALLQIQQYNNSLSQQKFQNQLGLTDAQIAAEMNGVNVAKDSAEANYYNAHSNLYNSEAAGGGRSASQLNDIQNSILGALVSKGILSGGGGQPFKLAGGVTPAQALQAAQGIGQGYGALPQNFLGGTVLGGVQGY